MASTVSAGTVNERTTVLACSSQLQRVGDDAQLRAAATLELRQANKTLDDFFQACRGLIVLRVRTNRFRESPNPPGRSP
jgi:hypothetical protein